MFGRIGGFDEDLVRNQDDEFNYRLRAAGGKILLSPAIRSIYYNRPSLNKLAKQYYQYGLYKVRALQKHPRQMQPRQFVPPLFTAGVVGGLVVSLFSPVLALIYGAVLALYLLANLVVSARIASKAGWKFMPLLPVLFITLHLSYGAGFIVGLWASRDHWQPTA